MVQFLKQSNLKILTYGRRTPPYGNIDDATETKLWRTLALVCTNLETIKLFNNDKRHIAVESSYNLLVSVITTLTKEQRNKIKWKQIKIAARFTPEYQTKYKELTELMTSLIDSMN